MLASAHVAAMLLDLGEVVHDLQANFIVWDLDDWIQQLQRVLSNVVDLSFASLEDKHSLRADGTTRFITFARAVKRRGGSGHR